MAAKTPKVQKVPPLRILTCCGVGMGTSLILRMNVEDILHDMGVPCDINAGIASEGASADVDLIMCSPELYSVVSGGKAPVVTVESFIDREAIKRKLQEFLSSRH